jgi:hypothetical protein
VPLDPRVFPPIPRDPSPRLVEFPHWRELLRAGFWLGAGFWIGGLIVLLFILFLVLNHAAERGAP